MFLILEYTLFRNVLPPYERSQKTDKKAKIIMPANRNSLSLQIVSSLLSVFGASFLALVVVGHNAITIADDASFARQERFAARNLETGFAGIPQQQRSATVWDDAVENVRARDETWMDDNLGGWMQDYFGHDENYVLDQMNAPVFVSVEGEIRPADAYARRADVLAPLVAQLRETMAEVSRGREAPWEVLAEVGVVTPVRLGNKVAVVSVVPVLSDTGEVVQAPGTEPLHIAVRYVDAQMAQEIGEQLELEDVTFQAEQPDDGLAGLPIRAQSGEPLSWLVWKPDRPGTTLFHDLLPLLLIIALAIGTLLVWIAKRLLRVSEQLQASEAQAHRDVIALEQAREAAEVADRAKMNFMSVVSHELRTPLTVILGYARLGKNLRQMPTAQRLENELRSHPINAGMAQVTLEELLHSAGTGMQKIERSGEHLLFLVNQLLDYAKMQTGRLEVDPKICDVRDVLEPVIDQMRILTEQKGLHLETKVIPCLMLADVTRTRQILINLMGNAIKFTDKGKISVVVREAENLVHIDVIDTGTGIEPHELEKIFEAFHQADLSSTRSAAGTGLGLSVAQELARLEGGTISVHSEVGIGSTFTLSLPRDTVPLLERAA